MILADTSIWIDHFRKSDGVFAALLNSGMVLTHPFVIGELALGNLRQRETILEALADLPAATVATDLEVLRLIEVKALYGRGIGFVDAHLLAAVLLTHGAELYTNDKRLQGAAVQSGLAISRYSRVTQ